MIIYVYNCSEEDCLPPISPLAGYRISEVDVTSEYNPLSSIHLHDKPCNDSSADNRKNTLHNSACMTRKRKESLHEDFAKCALQVRPYFVLL